MTADPKTVIAARAAQELRPGEIVNLGIGIPNLIPGHLGADTEIFLHTENGLLGVGPRPTDDDLDPEHQQQALQRLYGANRSYARPVALLPVQPGLSEPAARVRGRREHGRHRRARPAPSDGARSRGPQLDRGPVRGRASRRWLAVVWVATALSCGGQTTVVGATAFVGVSWNPTFNYNPDLFWDANPSVLYGEGDNTSSSIQLFMARRPSEVSGSDP